MMVRKAFLLIAFVCLLTVTNQLFNNPETAPENSKFDDAIDKFKSMINRNKDESSTSDSSTSESSDSDGKGSKISDLLESAKDTQQKTSQDLKEYKKNLKKEAKKNWKKLRQQIISETDASTTSFEELNTRLKNEKKELKRKAMENWLEFKKKANELNPTISSDSSDSSDNDATKSKFGALLGSAKDIQQKTSQEFKEYKKKTKKEAKEAWKQVKQEIIDDAKATNTSYEELSKRLRIAKKDLKRKTKEKWRSFRHKAHGLNTTMTDGMPNA